jgi:hypothetical protein
MSVADAIMRVLTPLTVEQRMRTVAMLKIRYGIARRGSNRFRQRDVARALRAVKDTGGAGRVEIDPVTGRISVILAQPDEPQASDDLDQWIAKREKNKNARQG